MECSGYKNYPEDIKKALNFYLDGTRAEEPGYMCYKDQEAFDNGDYEYDWEFAFLESYYQNALEFLKCMSKLYMYKTKTAIDKFYDVNLEIEGSDAYERFISNAILNYGNALNVYKVLVDDKGFPNRFMNDGIFLEDMKDQRLKNKIFMFCTEVGELINQ